MPLTLECAAERFKLALFCAVVTGMPAGRKAILCLKLAWIYRDLKDRENELVFISNALQGLKQAYQTETFPIGALDEPTTKYIIGDLLRRSGQFPEAMRWISEIIVSRTGVSPKLKERAMLVKDMIREKKST